MSAFDFLKDELFWKHARNRGYKSKNLTDLISEWAHRYSNGESNSLWDKFTEGADGLFSGFGTLLEALVSRLTGAALTPAEKEASALQLQNQQTLNEEDYQRKIDFYEMYESPEAMMRQYKSAGLNPALMYGGGASVSASGGVGTGSAAMPSAGVESIAGLVSAISGMSLRSKELQLEQRIKERELDLEEEKIGVQRNQSQAYSDYLRSQREGQDITNMNLQRVFDLQAGEVRAKTNLLVDNLQTAAAQRILLRNQVSESQARSSLIRVQTAIANCDASVRQKYNDIMVRSAQLQYDMMNVDSKYQENFIQYALRKNEQELTGLFLDNQLLGLHGKYYKGDRNWEHALGIARVVTTAAGAAVGGMIGMKSMRPGSISASPYTFSPSGFDYQYAGGFR